MEKEKSVWNLILIGYLWVRWTIIINHFLKMVKDFYKYYNDSNS